MAFRRTAFDKIGLFLDCFDRKGKSLMSYGDIEICFGSTKLATKLSMYPMPRFLHLIRGDRLNQEWFQRRFYWQGRSEGLFELLHFGRKHILKNCPTM
jgi:hypothetical protein